MVVEFPELLEGIWLDRNGWECRLGAALSHWRLFPCAKGTDSLFARFEFAIFSFSFIRSARLDGVGGPLQTQYGVPDDGVGNQPCARRYPNW